MHLTEVCNEEAPHLITHVATTPAPTADEIMVKPIHEALKKNYRLPSQHILDSGYITSHTNLRSEKEYE